MTELAFLQRQTASSQYVTVQGTLFSGAHSRVTLSRSPQFVAIVGRISRDWSVTKPIVLTVEQGDDGFVVSDSFVAMYGSGHTLQLAMHDYIHSLIEYFELLSERSSTDEANSRLFAHLSRYLRQSQSYNADQNQTAKATT